MSDWDIRGKRVVITGATSGIGEAAAIELARRGATLTLVVRNPAKADATVARLHEAAPGATVDVVLCDLADLSSVRSAAEELHKRLDRIDVLINNAGVNNSAAKQTADGFDEMMAANYLGPFLLTNLVLDLVDAGAPSRVVTVASEAHRIAGRLDPESFEQLGSYGRLSAQRAYGRTKLLDLLFALELATRLDPARTTSNALCPGLVATGLAGENRTVKRMASVASRTLLVRTPEQGARMTVALACEPLGAETGRFHSSTPGGPLLPMMPVTRDEALRDRVWERTAELVGL